MKAIFPITFLLLSFTSFTQQKTRVKLNLSGTYKYQGETMIQGDDTYGYFGTIQVVQLQNSRIAMSFFISKGAKSYTSGSFVDTLDLNGSTAIYKTSCDLNCSIVFSFSRKGV